MSPLLVKLIGGLAAILMIVLLVQDRNGWKAKAAKRQEQLTAEQSAHRNTVSSYRAAAELARKKDAANVARVRAEQERINAEVEKEYAGRVAAARAAAARLRQQLAARGGAGGTGAAPVSGTGTATGSVDGAAPSDRLSVSERLIATEQAIQLDELIKWVRRQSYVDNGSQ